MKKLPQFKNNLEAKYQIYEDTLYIREGGNAAKKLIQTTLSKHPNNFDRNLEFSRVSYNTINLLLPQKYGVFSEEDRSFLGRILYFLSSKNLIDSSYYPRFFIGSTRLAATYKYGSEQIPLFPGESEAVLQNALQAKKSFGDLDIDIIFLGTPEQIVDALSELDTSSFAGRVAKFGTDEVHSAIRVGNKVFQIDFIDVGNNFDSLYWNKVSSFVDLTKEIKGAFQGSLLRSLTKNKEVPKDMNAKSVENWVQSHPDSEISKKIMKKISKGFSISSTGFSYTPEGIKLNIYLSKGNTKTKVDFSSSPIQDFSNLQEIINFLMPGAGDDVFISSYNIAKWIKTNKTDEQIRKIWNYLLSDIQDQGLTEEEKNRGLAEIEKVLFASDINEISSMSAGGVSGVSNGFDKSIYKKRRRKKMNVEEQKLRNFIRKILKEKQELSILLEAKSNVSDTPNSSTGINVLEELLKKIIPTLEKDYKILTSSKKQRQSFRAHVTNAIARGIATMSVNTGALLDSPEIVSEVEIQVNPRDEKFIDISKKSSSKINDTDRKKDFSLPGQDETGRNLALDTFSKIEKQIYDSYSVLSDDTDRKIFRDYLLTNVKLYFDKFEEELSPIVEEPTTDEYEKEKSGGETSFSL